MKTEQQVLSAEPSSAKPGAWLKMKVIDDKGQPRDAYIKDSALAKLVTGPGFYEFEKAKNGQYWDIVGVRFLRPLTAEGQTTQASNGNGKASTAAQPRSPGVADVNVMIQNRAITAQVCIKAAAELLGKALDAGAFKAEGIIDTDLLTVAAGALARKFMDEARAFVGGNPTEKKGAYVDGDGRTHEPVGAEGA